MTVTLFGKGVWADHPKLSEASLQETRERETHRKDAQGGCKGKAETAEAQPEARDSLEAKGGEEGVSHGASEGACPACTLTSGLQKGHRINSCCFKLPS